MKKKDQKDKDVKKLNPDVEAIKNDVVVQRTIKCQKLADGLFKHVNQFTKENGTLSIFELNDVFIKLIHSFNKQQLMQEYQNLKDQQNQKN